MQTILTVLMLGSLGYFRYSILGVFAMFVVNTLLFAFINIRIERVTYEYFLVEVFLIVRSINVIGTVIGTGLWIRMLKVNVERDIE